MTGYVVLIKRDEIYSVLDNLVFPKSSDAAAFLEVISLDMRYEYFIAEVSVKAKLMRQVVNVDHGITK